MKPMMNRRRQILLGALLLVPVMLVAKGAEMRMRTGLTGGAISSLVPSGHADYRATENRSRLNVEVEDVNLPEGTNVAVFVEGTQIGTIRISAAPIRGGELELNTQDGQLVPKVEAGDVIVVRNGSTAILSGVIK